jgi:regulatory protein
MRYVTEPTRGEIDESQADADPEQVARTIVLRRLSVSPRTRRELADDLRKRGVPDEVADRVLNRFVDVGLVDDADFARMWVDSRQRTKGSARSVLRQELRTRGIAEDDVAQALECIDDESERERARALAARKVGSVRHLEPAVGTRRLVGMLMRRGYRHDVSLSVVREVLHDALPADGDVAD